MNERNELEREGTERMTVIKKREVRGQLGLRKYFLRCRLPNGIKTTIPVDAQMYAHIHVDEEVYATSCVPNWPMVDDLSAMIDNSPKRIN